MRLYIQEKNGLLKFNLPVKIDGSLLFTYHSDVNGLDNSINVDAKNGKWYLKSNGNINIIDSNLSIISEIELVDYLCIPVMVSGFSNYIYIFSLPSVDECQKKYEISNLKSISIGSSPNNNIIYKQNMMFDQHAVIMFEKNNWYLTPVNNESFVYLNNQRIFSMTPITIGDIIFMNGLRIIWMRNIFIIPMKESLYQVNGINLVSVENISKNSLYSEVSEKESSLVLYNENDYFSRIPNIRREISEEVINIDPPPGSAVSETDLPFLLSIGTSFTMLGMMSINFISLYNGIYYGEKDVIDLLPQIIMVSSMLIGSFCIPLLTKRWQKKLSEKRENLRQKKYKNYLLEKEKLLKEIKDTQRQILIENKLSVDACTKILLNKDRHLWCRSIRDDDFLDIRLGIGNRKSLINVTAPEEKFTLDDDNLYDAVVELGKKYSELDNVPISINLKNDIILSFIIQTKRYQEFINGFILQLLVLHNPLDLKIVVMTNSANSYRWNYLKYTTHNWASDFSIRFFASSDDELKSLCHYLDEEYLERKAKKSEIEERNKDVLKEKLEEYELYDSYYLIITDNFKEIRDYKFIQSLLESQFNYGFSMVILDKNMKNLSNECRKFLFINDNKSKIISDKVKHNEIINFDIECLSAINMYRVSRIIANIPIMGKDAESQLPNSISFLQMYNVGKIEQLNVRNRWLVSDPMSSLSVPIGVHTNGELFNLDLHEKFDGPHGLIAGSTGSGKSEFIITYILSMALNYDPREVQFVLIDYKGGGLAGAFENRDLGISIPHLAGTITNLDTAEMNRTLVSIQSELKRRQKQFNKVREQTGESTMDIYKYQRFFRDGIVQEPISHLFIISDEFAELKAQQPDFMSQLVSTARIGRSLGVHLILATQKPSGIVNDQIWSNSKFKVCLKVQTRADSMELLKRPDAASLKETGRFYLQVGYDEYFDIGQSAWAGDKYVPTERIVKKIDNSVYFVNNLGSAIKKSVEINKSADVSKDYGDQLTNIVKYLYNISVDDGFVIKKLWLPALKRVILLEDLIKKYGDVSNNSDFSINPIIGEYDAPAEQEQGLLTIDLLNNGNTIIYGSSGSGKENLITTIVYNLSQKLTPKDINIYIGDFGAETLKILNFIPHVGDVFVTDESQKLDSFIKMINKEFERRKKLYSDFGGNYIDYSKLNKKKDPFLLIILNNYENFVESYPRIFDVFSSLFRDGIKYGICFIVSSVQQNVLRSKVAQYFVNKICLKMPDNNDYRDILGAPRGMVPVDNYGRGIFTDGSIFPVEFQTADICPKESKVQFIREYGKKLSEKYSSIKVKKIPVLPDIVYVDDVLFELKGLHCVPIGIEKNSLEVYVYNFLEYKINLIAAKSIKNHIYFVYALIKQISYLNNVVIHIFDALSIYRGKYENVDLYEDNLENGFVMAYNNVKKDKSLKQKHIYFILGVSEFKNRIKKYNDSFEKLFYNVSNCKNNTFLFFDNSSAYKIIQVQDWFRNNINNTFGIWLGEDIGIQVSLGVMSLSAEDRNMIFPCIGYPIYQGNHMIIRYVVDGVDKKNE